MKITPLKRVPAMSAFRFQSEFADPAQPVILTGVANRWEALRLWTFDNLRSQFGHLLVPVRGSDDESQVFFGDAAPKNMLLTDYIDIILNSDRHSRRPYLGNLSLSDPDVLRHVAPLLAHFDFPDYFPGETGREVRLWIGAAGQKSTIHNDNYHNLNAQICGEKKFLLFAPSEYSKLYTRKINDSCWASVVNPQNADLQEYPLYGCAEARECTLSPGEILYIPIFWWHQALAATACVNLNVWAFSPDQKSRFWEQE